jgi:hypothetical protein
MAETQEETAPCLVKSRQSNTSATTVDKRQAMRRKHVEMIGGVKWDTEALDADQLHEKKENTSYILEAADERGLCERQKRCGQIL